MKEQINVIHYMDEYVLEEGIQRFMFPKPQTFICDIKEPRLVKAYVTFLSDKTEGAFIYCRKHHDFFDVSVIRRQQKTPRKTIVQQHHISYNPEVVVTIYKGEHWVLTQIQRRKKVSRGFITSLKVWIAEHEYKAKDLTKK